MPNPVNVHFDRPLANLAIKYAQSRTDFVADQAFAKVVVEKESDRYYKFNKGDFFRDEGDDAMKRAGAEESIGIGFRKSDEPYLCEQRSLHFPILRKDEKNQDAAIRLRQSGVQLLTQRFLIRKELDWASKFFVTGKWDTNTSVTGGDRWDTATGNPITQIRTAKRAVKNSTGIMPNIMVTTGPVWEKMIDNPFLVDRLDAGQTPGGPAEVMKSDVARLLELDEILVMDGIYNSAAEGATASMGQIGAKNCLLMYRTDAPSIETPSGGYNFQFMLPGAGNDGTSVKVLDTPLLNNSYRLEMDMSWDYRLTASDLGALLLTVIS